jgi:2-oxoglutarate dehydrogenase E1 component
VSDSLRERLATTPLSGGNAAFVEDLYERYLADPDSVAPAWRAWFDANGQRSDRAHGPVIAELEARARQPRRAAAIAGAAGIDPAKQTGVIRLIEAFRQRGHLRAALDPLGLTPPRAVPDLEPEFYGFTGADLDVAFNTTGVVGPDRMKLGDLLASMRRTYCGSVGFEFAHVSDAAERRWLTERIEGAPAGFGGLSGDDRRHLLEQLTAAEGLERYLHTKYVGQKRFSLEGGDALIPLLQDAIQSCGAQGVKEMVVGMAHRGRLNVLINVLGKDPKLLFSEFEGKHDEDHGEDHSGDVKYHMGFSSDVATPGGNVHLALAFNPSHLEIVDPVVEGSVRARQDRRGDAKGDQVVPILVHGDAAFSCQGVVLETMQLSLARGFRTGGTLHVVVNNQVGFTTHKPEDTRSTLYCTDIGKMFEAPVFHVNGDDPEAVLFVARLALAYRMAFHKDVIIDLVCYRRHGHNEADEPAATQPVMYKTIRAKPTTRALYAEALVKAGVVGADEPAAMVEAYRTKLDAGGTVAKKYAGNKGDEFTVDWSKYNKVGWDDPTPTGLPLDRLKALGGPLTTVPAGRTLHARVAKVVEDRRRMYDGSQELDWGAAETLAYAALLVDGYNIRLCGQDAGRGTFFHRHAVWHCQNDGTTHVALNALGATPSGRPQGRFTVIDSLLSEEAVMGFEYGYASAEPTSLVIWEAQFGDFANGAQAVIDQFIAAGEAKWRRMCGLTLFLPHGYEGQGPEHSSARLERYLQLCAQRNIQVCVPSTPAQAFHMIRRQMVRPLRKPLVVMTPKSLLRHKLAVSSLDELARGRFQAIIPEVESDAVKASKVERVVFCSGKVYYDLLEARRAANIDNVALVRVEQLYPFPRIEYEAQIAHYSYAREIVWCQEEPENQGAWYQIHHRLSAPLKPRHALVYAGRPPSASTAAGHHATHVAEQKALVDAALKHSVVKKEKA